MHGMPGESSTDVGDPPPEGPWAGMFPGGKPLIGVLHLPPLPGSPRSALSLEEIRHRVLRDAEALERGGIDGLILENLGDAPYFPRRVPPHTVAHMSALAVEVRRVSELPLGVNVLRNDARAALSVAAAAGAAFIRANVWIGARVTDQGIVQGEAHRVLRLRRLLGCEVRVFADVGVKHSAPLGERPLADEVREAVERGRADAIIVTGAATGRAAEGERVAAAKEAAGPVPVLVGSGVTPDSVAEVLARCDGAIVGTALKEEGIVDRPVDPARVEALVAAARGAAR